MGTSAELKNSTLTPEQMVDAGAGLSKIKARFPNKEACYSFYATYQAGRHEGVGDTCCMCGRIGDRKVRYAWQATYSPRVTVGAVDVLLLLIGFVHIKTASKMMQFETVHPFCGSCESSQWGKRLIAGLLQFLLLLTGVISLLLAPLGWAGLAYFWNDRQAQDGLSLFFWMGLIGTIGLAIGVYGLLMLDRLRVPKALQGILRRPFVFAGVKKV